MRSTPPTVAAGLLELADRLGRTEAAVRQRVSHLRALQLEGDVAGGAIA